MRLDLKFVLNFVIFGWRLANHENLVPVQAVSFNLLVSLK